MVHDHEHLKRTFAEKNEEFRRLMADHADYETRLQELQGKATLEESERVETTRIKKQKLLIKDRMETLLRVYIERGAGATVSP
ncbi:MAG: YdcH family protein [Acidobacteria bacterium]|nr:YdcH family protein [Acidobacteriota bacterium]